MLKTRITVLLFLILPLDNSVPVFTLPVLLSMLLGFSVRLGLNWSDNSITFKDSCIRLIFAFALCYMALFAWQDWQIKQNIVYTTFAISLLSLEIVNEGTKMVKNGLRAYGKKLINSILAKDEHI